MLRRTIVTLSLLLLPFCALAADGSQGMTRQQFEASLKYRHGRIALPGGLATLDIPSSFRYLGPNDAERVLVDAWGNPPGAKTLGMLFPADRSPLDDDGWGVVITYADDGHVADDEADSIDYTELLHKMQGAVQERNGARRKRGYPPLTLVGWAEPPHYDKASHKLYWAKELKVGDNRMDTLNYCVRVLGRKGVLELNAISAMDQLPSIRGEMQKVIAFTNFEQGSRYGDFDPSMDKVAGYGLAALVGGAVAAKAGLFAKLFAMLLAAKKLVLAAIVGIGAAIRGIFGRKKKPAR